MGASLCRPDWLLLRLLEFFFFLNLSFVVKGYVKASEATQMGSPKWNWFDPELSLKYFSYALQPYAKNNFLCCKGNVSKLQPTVKKGRAQGCSQPLCSAALLEGGLMQLEGRAP